VVTLDQIRYYIFCQKLFCDTFVNGDEDYLNVSSKKLTRYMENFSKSLSRLDTGIYGGNDLESSVPLYSKNLDLFGSCFAINISDSMYEPILLVKKIPKYFSLFYRMSLALAVVSLNEFSTPSDNGWITTTKEHFRYTVTEEDKETLNNIVENINHIKNNVSDIKVFVTNKCEYCFNKNSCDPYLSINEIRSDLMGKKFDKIEI